VFFSFLLVYGSKMLKLIGMKKENEQLAGCIEYLEKKVKYSFKDLNPDQLKIKTYILFSD